MKRFWKKASVDMVDGKYTVTLDGRNLRTPSKNKILLPSNRKQLAQLLAAEWDGQTSNLKPHSLPLVSSCSIIPPLPLLSQLTSKYLSRHRYSLVPSTASTPE